MSVTHIRGDQQNTRDALTTNVIGSVVAPRKGLEPGNLPSPPEADTVRSARRHGGYTVAEAASVVERSSRCWQRWERGESTMPRVLWAWFAGVVYGDVYGQGTDWNGYRFRKGQLHTPNGRSFGPWQLEDIDNVLAMVPAYRQTVEKLRAENALLKAQIESSSGDNNPRSQFVGSIQSAQACITSLWDDCRGSDDIGLRGQCDELAALNFQLYEMKARLSPNSLGNSAG